jgi:tetratricopeptide (TPR) repeat protein
MWSSQAHSQVNASICGPLKNHYGPFDYRTQKGSLAIVEEYHFTPVVEALIRGESGYLDQDIAYTLHTSPNHHRALMALARLADRQKPAQLSHLTRPVECYFERAIRFKADDTVVRILYAQFLTKGGRKDEALYQLDTAITQANDNAFSHYNIGLAYFDLGLYDKALAQAHTATALGFDQTALADQLKAANKWQEPLPAPTSESVPVPVLAK